MNQVEFTDYLGVNRQLDNRWEKQAVQPSLEGRIAIDLIGARIRETDEIEKKKGDFFSPFLQKGSG